MFPKEVTHNFYQSILGEAPNAWHFGILVTGVKMGCIPSGPDPVPSVRWDPVRSAAEKRGGFGSVKMRKYK